MTPTNGNATRAHKPRRAQTKAATEKQFERVTPIALVHDDSIASPAIVVSVDSWAGAAKRCIDVVGAAFGLVLVTPIVAMIAVLIKIESRGPVFFAHRRLGKGGGTFNCWKFRSMHEDAEIRLHADEELRHQYVSNHFKLPQHLDPRITRIGRFLRQSSLDELPQLWNVLCGEMSLVGPRPIVMLEAAHYAEELPVLLSVRPGLTGAWAVEGRSRVGYPMRASIELHYARSWTLGDDLRILARTPWAVVSQRGAF